jgi:hypothetical protein
MFKRELNMDGRQQEKYISLVDTLYFRFQSSSEIKQNFKNENIYNKFVKSLKILYENKNFEGYIKVTENIETILYVLNQLNHLTKDSSSIYLNNIQVIQNANQLIEICNNLFLSNIDTVISEEEFSQRYDNLLKRLNLNPENSNLILKTKSEQKEFRLFKNSNNSLSASIGQEDNNISLTKERLTNTIYRKQVYSHHKSYADVVIEKLLNNTIFDSIQDTLPIDFSNTPEGIITKIEEERLKTVGQIKELEDKFKKRESDFNRLQMLLEKSSTLEEDFNNAKEAVLKNIQLKQATSYWEEQTKRYHTNYIIYFTISIGIAILLIITTFLLINKTGLFIQDIPLHNENNSTSVINSFEKIVRSASFFNYVIFILYTTLVIWIIKILVKIMLSNYHLAVDANERVIMLNTYLVLLEDGQGFEENDRKVILDNIFRQTNHGIIKDETSVTIADIVSSFKK